MSAIVCSLSGAPLIHGVVSSKTGHLYEKSTILHYISLHGTCPHTSIPLQAKDLIELASNNTNIVSSQQSLPTLVQKLTGQLDALILQTHLLKQQLQERREQLATSLYRQDAAIRVIARLQDERDAGRQQITQLMQKIRDIQHQ